ncbi:hypothetical protein ACJROX_05985 [Pseudalkalibacillus sp. A8]|uniref:hypothetical protein n=1 Tax=Pseudalkalibacillus sp. A8 TaxID=3382641 RepID=UPI0038B4BE0A
MEVEYLKKWISVIVALIFEFILFHSTPSVALRTQVFFMGYPKTSITSGIIEDDLS